MNHGIAFGSDRLGDEGHTRLLRGSAALLDVAPGTRTDYVLPFGLSAQASWYHVVQRQFGGWKFFPTVLASVSVPSEDVSSVELNRSSRQPVVKQKADNPRHGKVKINSRYPIVLVGLEGLSKLAQLAPAFKIVVRIDTFLPTDNLGLIIEQQRKRSPDPDYTQGQVVFVQYKHPAAQTGL